ncbi:MAG: hypothetical protein HEP71_03165 [Roseivirga sp.]|nr:hypothetical protein [Roseivirga sp.]
MKEPSEEASPLRFENELKKLRLMAEYGATHIETDNEKLNPAMESQFLDYIQAFEEAAEKKETTKVFDLLNQPEVPAQDIIPDNRMAECLEYLQKLLASKHIYLATIYEVADREIYRFIVEELFDYEMDIINVPGLESHFTYEEFHPNLGEDAKRQAGDFLRSVFGKSFEYLHMELWNEISSGAQRSSSEAFIKYLETTIEPLNLKLLTVDTALVSLDEAAAEVHCQLHYELTGEDRITHKRTATASIGFHHAYGYTYINRVELPELGGNT